MHVVLSFCLFFVILQGNLYVYFYSDLLLIICYFKCLTILNIDRIINRNKFYFYILFLFINAIHHRHNSHIPITWPLFKEYIYNDCTKVQSKQNKTSLTITYIS